MWTQRQAIEVFHLLFLRQLGGRVDKSLFALKGGCNLRFFFRSVRYSEDIDLDVHTMAAPTLQKNVTQILASTAFLRNLEVHRLTITGVSAAKQTTTTQRWKIHLRAGDEPTDILTKIEFSRRSAADEAIFEPVDNALIQTYKLYPIFTQHYAVEAAFRQKVSALALRNETQARDVFDLKLLVDAGAGSQPLPPDVSVHLEQAIHNAQAMSYDAFSGQVVAYLLPEYQDDYRPKKTWESLQTEIVRKLEGLHERH